MESINYKSEVVDTVLNLAEEELRSTGKHLIKTETILKRVKGHINLADESQEREELLLIGIKQVIQSRLYCHGYFSIGKGYFVNVDRCQNTWYLEQIIDSKEDVLDQKAKAKKRLEELIGMNGQMYIDLDEAGNDIYKTTKTEREVIEDLEADAI